MRSGTLGLFLLVMAAASARADSIDRLMETLAASRSYKVRIQAAAVLARFPDPRVDPALARAAGSDPHPTVRRVAARLLARRSVRNSPTAVAPARLHQVATEMVVSVRIMGDRSGRASRGLREKMRAELLAHLQQERAVRIGEGTGPITFVIDGAIRKLEFQSGSSGLEATCAVELVISSPARGILTVATGEATVQHPHGGLRPGLRAALEEEALVHAVRGAQENVHKFLAAQ